MKLKYILSAMVVLLFLNVVKAQNPALGDSPRGTTKIGSKIGINTNGATAGQVVTFSGGVVTWGAAGAGSVPTSRTISTTAPLSGGGDLSANRTLIFDGSQTFNAIGATNLTASELRVGTLPDARLSSAVVLTNGVQTISGAKTFTDNMNLFRRIGIDPAGTLSPLAFVHTVSTNVASDVNFMGDNYGAANMINFVARRARGTFALPTAVQTDDALFLLSGRGYGATGFSSGGRANISGNAAQAWTDSAHGTYLRFSTTSNNTVVLSEQMRLDQGGNLGIGTTTPTSKLHVVGTANITSDLTASGNTTLGANSSSSMTVNGTTITFPNGAIYNAGIWSVPVLSTTMITNSGAGIFTSGSLIAGTAISAPSVTTTTVDGQSYVDSGTNLTLNIISGGGLGVAFTKARMTLATTSPSGGSAINTIYTNGNQRTFVSVSSLFPAGSGAYVWSCNGVGGAVTNTDDIKIITALTTNNVSSIIQPNDLYMISNFTGTAPTVIKWNEKRL